uniref:Uncharacterized protein n=1 Tax=Bacteriophage sp. TaxID=38018 RepID=A0A8D9PGP8_9VIRU|nr:MAG TPA: hypothetical protein [Bacteriophage sp.]
MRSFVPFGSLQVIQSQLFFAASFCFLALSLAFSAISLSVLIIYKHLFYIVF